MMVLGILALFIALALGIVGVFLVAIGVLDRESGPSLFGVAMLVLAVPLFIGGETAVNDADKERINSNVNHCLADGKQAVSDGGYSLCFTLGELTEQANRIKVCLDKGGVPIHSDEGHNAIKCVVTTP